MELKEAFDIIDATLGMFRSFASEIENGDLKDKFLLTPVYSSTENYFDMDKNTVESEAVSYYNYVDGDKEYKRYIVNIRPVCSYLVNEWPSHKAKRIRKKLIAITSECANYCETFIGGIADIAEDEGFCYNRYMRTHESCDIETVMLVTIHEMCHALSLTEDGGQDLSLQSSRMLNPIFDSERELLLGQIDNLKNEVNQLVREKTIFEKTMRELQEKVNLPVSNIVIAEDRKIDVIKILHAMCKIGLFKTRDGSIFTIKEVMKFFGEILNDNFTEYSSNLSTSKATTKESSFLEVFEELHNAAKKYLKKS